MDIIPLIEEVSPSLYQVDLHFDGKSGYSSGYIIKDEASAIIETGTGKAVPLLLGALGRLDIPRQEVRYVIVTHIHLDHAGGAGELISHLPEARLIVHEKGGRHLVDPRKLLSSAREVYGERFDGLFGDIRPVPAERVILLNRQMSLNLGRRVLSLLEAPGHAYHHLIVSSPTDGGIFSGDSAGILPFSLRKLGPGHTILTTTPTQFDPPAMKESLKKMQSLAPERLFLTHFGVAEAGSVLSRSISLVDAYMEIGRESLSMGENTEQLAARLRAFHIEELKRQGVTTYDPSLGDLEMDLSLNAAGILHYIAKESKSAVVESSQ